jgi:membrane protease YdiL (CAAX protease family)
MKTTGLRQALLFCLLAIGVSWVYWFAVIASTAGWWDVSVPLTPFGAFGPAIAAVILAARGGRSSVAQLFRRFGTQGLSLAGTSVAVLAWPVILTVSSLIAFAAGQSLGPSAPVPWWLLGLLPVEVFLLTSIGEELGWRGFALPLLLSKARPTLASLAIGCVWALWHAPLWFMPGVPQTGSFAEFAVSVVAMSMMYTAVYISSAPSILPALLLHTFQDASVLAVTLLWPKLPTDGVFWEAHFWIVIAAGLTASIVIERQARAKESM